jgi:hypothetical protein
MRRLKWNVGIEVVVVEWVPCEAALVSMRKARQG